MRKNLERVCGKVADREMPSAAYLAAKLEQAELEDPRAACFADAHSMMASFDAQNRLRVVKKSRKGTLPAN
eukprot:2768672-Amphidinium_carterae.1